MKRGLEWESEILVVQQLLKDPRVDPTARQNMAFLLAAKYGHLDVLELLVSDSRVNPTEQQKYRAFDLAVHAHWNVVPLLREYANIDKSAVSENMPNV